MSQPKKDAVVISMKLDRSVHDLLVEYCSQTGLTKTAATEQILDKYLSRYFLKSHKQ